MDPVYRQHGLAGLRDRPRSDQGGVRNAGALIEEAVRLRLEQPARSAAHIVEMLFARPASVHLSRPFQTTFQWKSDAVPNPFQRAVFDLEVTARTEVGASAAFVVSPCRKASRASVASTIHSTPDQPRRTGSTRTVIEQPSSANVRDVGLDLLREGSELLEQRR